MCGDRTGHFSKTSSNSGEGDTRSRPISGHRTLSFPQTHVLKVFIESISRVQFPPPPLLSLLAVCRKGDFLLNLRRSAWCWTGPAGGSGCWFSAILGAMAWPDECSQGSLDGTAPEHPTPIVSFYHAPPQRLIRVEDRLQGTLSSDGRLEGGGGRQAGPAAVLPGRRPRPGEGTLPPVEGTLVAPGEGPRRVVAAAELPIRAAGADRVPLEGRIPVDRKRACGGPGPDLRPPTREAPRLRLCVEDQRAWEVVPDGLLRARSAGGLP